jgi:hypothetical protein
MAKTKVLILGGGIAGLATAISLLDDGGAERYDVTLVCMEHRLGGKAASWRLPDGRLMETGFHSLFGYYTAVPALLERAGRSVRDPRWFTSNRGVHRMYDQSARAMNLLRVPKHLFDVASIVRSDALVYRGMTASQRLRAGLWFARFGLTLLTMKPTPDLDDYGFTAWCVAHGLDLDLTGTGWFKYIFDLTYNYPHEGSAYVGVQGFKDLIGYDNSDVLYFNGGMSEVLIAPLAAHLKKLGGRIRFCTKTTRLKLDPAGRRVASVATRAMAAYEELPGVDDHVLPTIVRGANHPLDDAKYPVGDPRPMDDAPEVVLRAGEDFDVLVSALPLDSLRALLLTTPDRRVVMDDPALAALWKLRSVVSLSLRMWLTERVVPRDVDTVVLGTPQPTATVIDYANRVDALRDGGSVVELLGQEGLDGDLDDDELARRIVHNFADLPFVDRGRFDPARVLAQADGNSFQLRRNTAHHMRYALLEPGHWRRLPGNALDGYDNLAIAGDWIRSSQPTISTEAAARSGLDAAAMVRTRTKG